MANIWPIFLHTAWSFKGLLCQKFVYKHRGRFIGQLDIVEIQKKGGGVNKNKKYYFGKDLHRYFRSYVQDV